MKFRKQFILTKKRLDIIENWNATEVSDYLLYTHHELEVNLHSENGTDLIMLGDAFDYENVNHTNLDILKSVSTAHADSNNIFEAFDKYSGTFIVIYRNALANQFHVFNDATAQREIYYHKDSEHGLVLGSQPKIITRYFGAVLDQSKTAQAFYSSKAFKSRKVYVGDLTEYEDIKHLKPNHYINIQTGETSRFFPYKPIVQSDVDKTAEKAAKMISGFLESASLRYKLLLPVSAGWDSRVLLAASKNIQRKCHYYVFKGQDYSDHHLDIRIPKKLLAKLNLELHIVQKDTELDPSHIPDIDDSLSFPRYENLKYIMGYWARFPDHLSIIGNVSEIARNFWSEIKQIDEFKIAILQKFESLDYATIAYKKWIEENQELFESNGYQMLDMLYWEENCGNWVAKSSTEAKMGVEYFLPFNSRELLETLLSVDSQYRQKENSQLYIKIIDILWAECLSLPINPSAKKKVISVLQKIGMYSIYRNLLLKFQLLTNKT